jgi:organic radical activating enzyme
MGIESLKMQEGAFKVSGDRAFYTLQGEGVSMGEPAVFLRLHFCNLRCGWCDTPYAVFPDREDFKTESKDWTIEETAQNVEGLWGCKNPEKKRRLIITGGEPLIQRGKIDALLDRLPDWEVEIETNGTVMPTEKQLGRCRFNCSPKLENSGNPRERRINGKVIEALAKVKSSFKFVVTKPEELDEIEKDYLKPFNIPIDKVILMPEGKDNQTLQEHSQAVAEYAKEKGYRLLGRLQVNVWGNSRRT